MGRNWRLLSVLALLLAIGSAVNVNQLSRRISLDKENKVRTQILPQATLQSVMDEVKNLKDEIQGPSMIEQGSDLAVHNMVEQTTRGAPARGDWDLLTEESVADMLADRRVRMYNQLASKDTTSANDKKLDAILMELSNMHKSSAKTKKPSTATKQLQNEVASMKNQIANLTSLLKKHSEAPVPTPTTALIETHQSSKSSVNAQNAQLSRVLDMLTSMVHEEPAAEEEVVEESDDESEMQPEFVGEGDEETQSLPEEVVANDVDAEEDAAPAPAPAPAPEEAEDEDEEDEEVEESGSSFMTEDEHAKHDELIAGIESTIKQLEANVARNSEISANLSGFDQKMRESTDIMQGLVDEVRGVQDQIKGVASDSQTRNSETAMLIAKLAQTIAVDERHQRQFEDQVSQGPTVAGLTERVERLESQLNDAKHQLEDGVTRDHDETVKIAQGLAAEEQDVSSSEEELKAVTDEQNKDAQELAVISRKQVEVSKQLADQDKAVIDKLNQLDQAQANQQEQLNMIIKTLTDLKDTPKQVAGLRARQAQDATVIQKLAKQESQQMDYLDQVSATIPTEKQNSQQLAFTVAALEEAQANQDEQIALLRQKQADIVTEARDEAEEIVSKNLAEQEAIEEEVMEEEEVEKVHEEEEEEEAREAWTPLSPYAPMKKVHHKLEENEVARKHHPHHRHRKQAREEEEEEEEESSEESSSEDPHGRTHTSHRHTTHAHKKHTQHVLEDHPEEPASNKSPKKKKEEEHHKKHEPEAKSEEQEEEEEEDEDYEVSDDGAGSHLNLDDYLTGESYSAEAVDVTSQNRDDIIDVTPESSSTDGQAQDPAALTQLSSQSKKSQQEAELKKLIEKEDEGINWAQPEFDENPENPDSDNLDSHDKTSADDVTLGDYPMAGPTTPLVKGDAHFGVQNI